MPSKEQPTLTDLPMVKEGRAERLRNAGIHTVDQLWKADLKELQGHPAFDGDLGFLHQIPLLQGYAEAFCKQEAVIYAADQRIFDFEEPIIHMDLEFDGPSAEVFLYGMIDHETGKETQWFEHTHKGQKQLLTDFRQMCLDQDPTIVTWGGRSSDMLQLKNACDKHRLKKDWLEDVRWFDLHTDVIFTGSPEMQRIYLPVKKFKSEVVAAFFGYQKPRLKVRDGYHALHLYRAYKRKQREGIKRDLMEYNIEDVKHLRLILNGLKELMG